jgi:hypothetical protein
MPQQKPKPSTAEQRANEALDRAMPEGKTPARKTLAFLLEGSHDDPSAKPNVELSGEDKNNTSTTNFSGNTSTTKLATTTRKIGNTIISGETLKRNTIAPERDFQRVPNSVTREVMASRLFRGKSKQVWDYLWSVSRAAIIPTRTVRRSRPQIRAGSGLGSMNTVDAAIEHLRSVGLIVVRSIVGESNGNEYEIFTPEEVATQLYSTPNLTGNTSLSGNTKTTQNLVIPVLPESGNTNTTLTINGTASYGDSKTSFKTKEENTDDDAHARRLVAQLLDAERELTGKFSTNSDCWDELGKLLVTELKIAAARTTISNVPAFLTEHLRRRLWKVDKKSASEIALEPEQESTPRLSDEEKRTCPDCAGTNFWYPEGPDKGVAKCKHSKLITTTSEKQ